MILKTPIMYKKSFSLLYLVLGFAFSVLAQDFPPAPKTLVTDYTGTLTSTQTQQLENKLVAFDDSTSTQIAVVIMKSVGSYDIADYGVRLAQNWGIGGREHNNGILLLVALGDRAVTIQTGYGLEGAVPDAIAYRIIENEIKPAFRLENYFLGIDRATDALIAYTKGEYKANPREEGSPGGSIVLLIFVIALAIIIISAKSNNDNNGGQVVGRRGAADAFWWTMMMGGSGGSSHRGGGFGSGGGFGGGGFGGFGGGGFGGGGASGRW